MQQNNEDSNENQQTFSYADVVKRSSSSEKTETNKENKPLKDVKETAQEYVNYGAEKAQEAISSGAQKINDALDNIEDKVENIENIPVVEGVKVMAGEAVDYATAKVNDVQEFVEEKTEEVKDKLKEIKKESEKKIEEKKGEIPPSQFDGAIKKAADIIDYAVDKAYDAKDFVQEKLHEGPFHIETNWKSDKEEIEYLKNKTTELKNLIERSNGTLQTITNRLNNLENKPGFEKTKEHKELQQHALPGPGDLIGAALHVAGEVKELAMEKVYDTTGNIKSYAVGKITGVTDYAVEKVANTTGYIQQSVYHTTGYDLGEKVQQIDQYAIDKVKQTIGIDVGESVHMLEKVIGITSQSDPANKATA